MRYLSTTTYFVAQFSPWRQLVPFEGNKVIMKTLIWGRALSTQKNQMRKIDEQLPFLDMVLIMLGPTSECFRCSIVELLNYLKNVALLPVKDVQGHDTNILLVIDLET